MFTTRITDAEIVRAMDSALEKKASVHTTANQVLSTVRRTIAEKEMAKTVCRIVHATSGKGTIAYFNEC